MSEYERTRGKIKKVETDNIEEYCKQVLVSKGENLDEMPCWDDSYMEWLVDQYDEEYVRLNDELYTLENYENVYDPEPDYCNLTHLPDGTILFETMYYNGGTNWQEMVEYRLKQICQKSNIKRKREEC